MPGTDRHMAGEASRRGVPAARSDATHARGLLGAPGAPWGQQLLALQAAAGNRAVSTLVAATVQRSPQSWARDTASIVTLTPGKARTSLWPPIVDLVRSYGLLPAGDRTSRAATLGHLETAIRAWQENQKKNLYSSSLDKKKAVAVGTLGRLIADEWAELRQAPAPAAPVPAAAVPAPAIRAPSLPRPPAPIPRTATPVAIPAGRDRTDSSPEGLSWSPSSWGPNQGEAHEVQFGVDLAESPSPGDLVPVPERGRAPAPAAAGHGVTSGSESEEEEPVAPGGLAAANELLARKGIRALPGGVYLRVHLTKKGHVADINAEGLTAGKKPGIGLPETARKGDPEHLYALDLANAATTGFVRAEAGGGMVGMISRGVGDKDVNYPKGGAVRYGPVAPPVRGFQQSQAAQNPPDAYSFPLPLTPRSSSALAEFVNEHLPSSGQLSPDEVVDAVNHALVSHSILTFAGLVRPAPPPTHT